MAAGLTIKTDRIGDLRAFLEEHLAVETEAARQNQSLKIDAALTASGATLGLIEQIEKAGPYGAGNPSPMFAFPAHRVVYADIAGTDHVRCTIAASDGSRLKAIAFRVADTDLGELPSHRALDASTYRWKTNRQRLGRQTRATIVY